MVNHHEVIIILLMSFYAGVSLYGKNPGVAGDSNPGQADILHQIVKSDSTKVHFPVDGSTLDNESKKRLDIFSGKIDSIAANDVVTSVSVTGSSSPDGPEKLNNRLASDRANSVLLYLFSGKDFDNSLIEIFSLGENWDLLREYVIADSLLPYKKKVLETINSELTAAEKEAFLKQYKGGTIWTYLKSTIFPQLRFASVNVSFLNNPTLAETVLFDEDLSDMAGAALPPPICNLI